MEQGEGLLALSQRDRDRLKELHGVIRGQQGLTDAAGHLGLSTKQARRLLERIVEEGDQGVIHRLRGRSSNRGIAARIRAKAVKRLRREEYHDFGPTLAAEHLERIDIYVSRETVRKWMQDAGLWRPRPRKVKAVHVWRERREAFGELVLVDTSEHDWLEGRGPKLYLVALIDDATSRLWARFVDSDTTVANLQALRDWLELYGRPVALYTDKNSIFLTPRCAEKVEKYGPPPPTDYAAALEDLRIEWIAAHSPQAKGRVERAFGTLQDRLLKEMRVGKVHTLDKANQFLREEFIPFWNGRFTKKPRSPRDAHRPLGPIHLDSVLCHRHERLVTSDYTLSLDGRLWAISRQDVLPGLRKSRVLVEQRLDGSHWVRFRKKFIPLRPLPQPAPVAATPSGLRPSGLAAKKKSAHKRKYKPAPDHPWRQPFKRDTSTLHR
jgi:DNA-binding Lrp family transcriptional regulator